MTYEGLQANSQVPISNIIRYTETRCAVQTTVLCPQGILSGIFLKGGVPFSEAAHRRGTRVIKAAPEDLIEAIANIEEASYI